MLWIYNKENTNIDFFQIFIGSNTVYENDNNTIYSLESDLTNNFEIKNIDKIDCDEYIFIIRIIDQLISFIDASDGKLNNQTVFTTKMNFIDPTSNKFNLPIFNFTYKKVNNNRMPNLLENNYNFYSKLHFKIYKISNNIQYIIETNHETKIIKKYFITNNLNLLNNYIK